MRSHYQNPQGNLLLFTLFTELELLSKDTGLGVALLRHLAHLTATSVRQYLLVRTACTNASWPCAWTHRSQ